MTTSPMDLITEVLANDTTGLNASIQSLMNSLPSIVQSKTVPTRTDLELSQIATRVIMANQGMSNNIENGRLELVPASLFYPGSVVKTINNLSANSTFYQVDPRDCFPNVIHYCNTGSTTPLRYDLSLITPGYAYCFATGNSPAVLDTGRADISWGNGEMVPRNYELYLYNGEGAIVGGSVSSRYVYMLSNDQGGRFNGRVQYRKEQDGTWTMWGFTQNINANSSLVLDFNSLASGFFKYSPLQTDGSGSMAIGLGYISSLVPIKNSATADTSGGLEAFNIISGNSTTPTTAQFSIRNNFATIVGASFEVRNLEVGTQRGYTGARFVRPNRPMFLGQSLGGHFVQGVAGDAYRKRLVTVLG